RLHVAVVEALAGDDTDRLRRVADRHRQARGGRGDARGVRTGAFRGLVGGRVDLQAFQARGLALDLARRLVGIGGGLLAGMRDTGEHHHAEGEDKKEPTPGRGVRAEGGSGRHGITPVGKFSNDNDSHYHVKVLAIDPHPSLGGLTCTEVRPLPSRHATPAPHPPSPPPVHRDAAVLPAVPAGGDGRVRLRGWQHGGKRRLRADARRPGSRQGPALHRALRGSRDLGLHRAGTLPARSHPGDAPRLAGQHRAGPRPRAPAASGSDLPASRSAAHAALL
ncbi:hypothetical protein KCV01_g15437, partial [Aureobasidium melanogenum]